MANNNTLITRNDASVADNQKGLTVGPRQALLQDYYLIKQMANFNRERIHECPSYAKDSWATTCWLEGEQNTIIHKSNVRHFTQQKEVIL